MKNTYLGIDLGTSSIKLLLADENGNVLATHSESYPVSYPQDGWSEQNPCDWISALHKAVPIVFENQNKSALRGISFAGQMHGLVALDKNDNVIRPCILWNDGRCEKQTRFLNETIGKQKLSCFTANVAFAGFTAPKILWLKENEPENFAKIAKIMLPKDYLAFYLSGVHSTDFSDASGTLLLDVKNKRWSSEMLEICSITQEVLPQLFESFEPVGKLKKEFCDLWGFENVVIGAGAGDNSAGAVGSGVVENGDCNVSLGTSGTLFVCQNDFFVDDKNSLHSFCHSNGKYHLLGCILSAASCFSWWMDVSNGTDFDFEQSQLDEHLSQNDVFFLPYLMGERSPHNDVFAKGAFVGLRPTTTRKQMTLAVLEGVAFALKDCLDLAKQSNLKVLKTRICGGGAKSYVWKKIIANVFGVPVETPTIEQGPSFGSAILAMVACGKYKNVEQATQKIVTVSQTVFPVETLTKNYQAKHEKFKKYYPALKGLF